MPSDPTTKQLIHAARERADLVFRGGGVTHRLLTTMADRLEEVDLRLGDFDASAYEVRPGAWLVSVHLPGFPYVFSTPHLDQATAERIRDRLMATYGASRSPEPSDPPTVPRCHDCGALDWVATRGATIAHCASCGHSMLIRPGEHGPKPKVEPSDPEPEDVLRTSAPVQVPATGCEPEDDPWEDVERYAKESPASRWDLALVDLRERVQILTQIARDNHGRITTLERHADRGSEAVTALEERVDGLSRRIEDDRGWARRTWLDLQDRVEKLEAHRG